MCLTVPHCISLYLTASPYISLDVLAHLLDALERAALVGDELRELVVTARDTEHDLVRVRLRARIRARVEVGVSAG